jgi:cytochrome c peroxidase
MEPKREATYTATLFSVVRAACVRRRSITLRAVAGTAAAFMLGSCGGGSGGTGDSAAVAARTEDASGFVQQSAERGGLDDSLQLALRRAGFTGTIESKLRTAQFLGRKVDARLADLGRMLFFDTIMGLHNDNACAGCHSPAHGFSDTQSIAIGVDNNGIVGPHRTGPRNQRRSPLVVNTAFFPNLMWNGRFSAPSGNPFNNSQGFKFPPPEGVIKFLPNDPSIEYLLVAQGHIPSTELVEMAGFTGTKGTIGPLFDQFDNAKGDNVPLPDASGFRNEPIRQAVLARLNGTPEYRTLFGKHFFEVATGGLINFSMVGQAIAEFEFTLVRADAPIDRYARGQRNAMSESQKRGALLFFGKGNCVACHAVAGESNEMFSDFKMHAIGVPQIAPAFGVGKGNVPFDGLNANEDFGLEQITGDPADRYKFRSSPLRNVALQPAFFHNGAFTRLEDAIRHHLNVSESAKGYKARKAGVDDDLTDILGPIDPVLAQSRLDPLLREIHLSDGEFNDLVAFVRDGLLDPGAKPAALCPLIPRSVPSGRPLLKFEGCSRGDRD